jgi:hypothetical protein
LRVGGDHPLREICSPRDGGNRPSREGGIRSLREGGDHSSIGREGNPPVEGERERNPLRVGGDHPSREICSPRDGGNRPSREICSPRDGGNRPSREGGIRSSREGGIRSSREGGDYSSIGREGNPPVEGERKIRSLRNGGDHPSREGGIRSSREGGNHLAVHREAVRRAMMEAVRRVRRGREAIERGGHPEAVSRPFIWGGRRRPFV